VRDVVGVVVGDVTTDGLVANRDHQSARVASRSQGADGNDGDAVWVHVTVAGPTTADRRELAAGVDEGDLVLHVM